MSIVIGSASLVRQTTERVNPLKVLFRFNIISKLKSAKPNNQLIIWVPEALAIDDSKSDYTMTNKPIPFNAKVLILSKEANVTPDLQPRQKRYTHLPLYDMK